MYEFNQFANGRFARTQPREWRYIPFASERRPWRAALRAIGIVLLYAVVFGVSLWAISEQNPRASSTHVRAR